MDIMKDRYGNYFLSTEEGTNADELYQLYLDAGGTDYKDRVNEMQNELDREGERIVGLEDQLANANDTINELNALLGASGGTS